MRDKFEQTATQISRIPGSSLEADRMTELLIQGARNFITDLFGWMTDKYLQQKQEQGEELRKEIWAYISHLVRNIFAALYKIRHLGFNRSLAEQAWVTLKAFKLQNKICNQGFLDHKIVIKVLYQHLKSNVITKT